MKSIKKLLALTLLSISIMGINATKANAAWKQDSIGWWYTEGNSWATGWRVIDSNWYYFYSDGYMARNQSIDGYYVDSNGAWTQRKLTLDEAVNIIRNNREAYSWIESNAINVDDFVKEFDSNSVDLKIGSTNIFDVTGRDENLYYFSLGIANIYVGTNSGKLYVSTGGSGVTIFALVQNGKEVKQWMNSREAVLDQNGKQIGWNYDTPLSPCTLW